MGGAKIEPGMSDPGASGFTLIELIVATAISALVIGIVSVCFSFALRMWQSTANSKPDQTFRLAELLGRQLAECDPTPVNFPSGPRPLFIGKDDSLCFITSHSVKAISKGAPVAVRYAYDSGSRTLHYSEMVLNPYHPEQLEQFAGSSGEKNQVRTYRVDFSKFTLNYAGRNAREFSSSWDSTGELPLEILLSWEGTDKATHSTVCMVNSPFPIQPNPPNSPTPGNLVPSMPGGFAPAGPGSFVPPSPPKGYDPPSPPAGGFNQ